MVGELQWPGYCHTSRSLGVGKGSAHPPSSVHIYENMHIYASRVNISEKGLRRKPFPDEGFLLLCFNSTGP